MTSSLYAALMFPALFALILLGIPVAFALIATAAAFGWLFFGAAIGPQLYGRLLEVAQGFTFAAVPMFILMGAVLERSGLAERLFTTLQLWLGRVRGGLALSAMLMGGIFAAATGIIGAVEVVIGMMAIPVMLRQRYDKPLIAGTITAAGSLGTIIPPSVLCVVYGGIGQVPVTDLFAACLLPGLLMWALFLAYIALRCALDPGAAPVPIEEARVGGRLGPTLTGLLPPALLIIAVLGSLLAGIASPTEAAAVGALGAILLTAANRRLTVTVVRESLQTTLSITSFILFIVLGGTMFSSIFYVLGGGGLVRGTVTATSLPTDATLWLFLLVVFLMGFVLDWATIILVTLPIFAPLLHDLAVDPLWFAVLMIVTLQTSYLTPPMAPAIFYLRSIAPPEIRYGHMVRGVLPFIACQGLTLLAVWLLPSLATWLPARLTGP